MIPELPSSGDPWPWICGVLATANAMQYGRDWLRERRYQKGIEAAAAALAEAQARHRADLLTMIPALTRVLDWLKQ